MGKEGRLKDVFMLIWIQDHISGKDFARDLHREHTLLIVSAGMVSNLFDVSSFVSHAKPKMERKVSFGNLRMGDLSAHKEAAYF